MRRIPEGLLLRAQEAAEKTAIDHVRYMRNLGVPLEEAAQAIGLDPANVTTWDAVTQAYALCARDMMGGRAES